MVPSRKLHEVAEGTLSQVTACGILSRREPFLLPFFLFNDTVNNEIYTHLTMTIEVYAEELLNLTVEDIGDEM